MTSALLGPAEIRSLADELGFRPRKMLGQNFLHDANTIRRIVRTAELAPDDVVLEIGPGLGSLTLGLLAAGHAVTAVEIDPVLADALPSTVDAHLPQAPLTVVTADAMRVRSLPGAAPTALVANLPYNVAVPVVLHLLETLPSLRTGLVLVQAEVADRLAAGPGSKVYGVPSVKAAWYARTTRAGAVSRSVFWPVPNVDSGLVRLVRHARPRSTSRGPRCSPSSTPRSRSGARCCARPCPGGPARRRRPWRLWKLPASTPPPAARPWT